jgi:HEAT repeat protein
MLPDGTQMKSSSELVRFLPAFNHRMADAKNMKRQLSHFCLVLLTWACGTLRADEATDQLAKELVDVVRDVRLDLRERVAAAKMIGKLGSRAAGVVPDLIAQLKRTRGAESELLQEAVIDTLASIGSAAKPALPTLAANMNRSIDLDLAVKRASEQIISADDAQDVIALTRQLSSRDVGLRLRAAKALGGLRLNSLSALPALRAALSDSDGDVRRAAATAIRLIQPDAKPTKELLQVLVLDLTDPDDGIRLLAVRSLGRYGTAASSTLPEVEKLLTDPERDVRKAAADAMTRMATR